MLATAVPSWLRNSSTFSGVFPVVELLSLLCPNIASMVCYDNTYETGALDFTLLVSRLNLRKIPLENLSLSMESVVVDASLLLASPCSNKLVLSISPSSLPTPPPRCQTIIA